MLFKTAWMNTLFQGKLSDDHISATPGRPVILNEDNHPFTVAEVEFAIPDDETQAEKLRAGGFRVHTPMSMVLGPDSTQA